MNIRTGAVRWLLSVIAVSKWMLYTIATTNGEKDVVTDASFSDEAFELDYLPGLGYRLKVQIGNQHLSLKLISSIEGIVLFRNGSDACQPTSSESHCYDPKLSSTATWCKNTEVCVPGKPDFQCEEVHSFSSILPATTTDFRTDGVNHLMQTIEGYESVSIHSSALTAPVTFDRVPVKMASNVVAGHNVPVAAEADGFFGIAGGSISCRQRSIWEELLVKHDGFYVLDLNASRDNHEASKSSAASTIIMGSSFVREHEVLWAERRQVGGIFTDASIEFSAYGMSMCGVNLFGRTSGYWQIAIDLASQCLVLPRNFWLSLMAQLPVVDGCYGKDPPKMCAIRRVDVSRLPAIEFKLRHGSDDKVIRIPLQDLLMDGGETPTLCIVPDEDTPTPLVFTNRPSIKFGYKVLELLRVVVDTKGHRVGFVHKRSVETSNEICVPPIECVGDQTYMPQLNYCLQPICTIWAFKRLDPETGRCVTSPVVKVIAYIVIIALSLMQCREYILRRNAFERARRLCE